MFRLPAACLLRRLPATACTTVALLLLGLIGCAGVPKRPPVPPAPTVVRPKPGYDGLVDSLGTVDATRLRGRRVALDPGHGGFFSGALGVNGLTEAEVNLGVALRLRDLLLARGAQVLMTRTENRDFLTPADSSLRSDLAERSRLANAWNPDLFLSIHHNADAGGLHDVNETQTYYKLGDDGPSLDVAQDVHRALVRNVGIEKNKVVPGNFYVVRTSAAPALLTETSYITNPDVEARLRLPEKQQLEAEAMLIGLARYFARPVPVIERFAALDSAGRAADTLVTNGFGPRLEARIRGGFDRAELRLDGEPVPFVRDDDRLTWSPGEPLLPGPHRAILAARLGGVGAARERILDFTVRRPAVRLRWQSMPARVPRMGGPIAVRVERVDAYGFRVAGADSVAARTTCRCDTLAARGVRLVEGEGWLYLRAAARGKRPAARRPAVELTLRSRGLPEVAARIPGQDSAAAVVHGAWLVRESSDTLGTPPFAWRPAGATWLNADGFAALAADSQGVLRLPALAGYRPVPSGTGSRPDTLRVAAIAGGAFQGRRITLDPEGGGDDGAGQGPDGTRASHLNLECARILAGLLEAAGAQVRLTREGDLSVSEVERVQLSEAFRADRFLRIGHRAAKVGYYFSSAAGRRWGERTAREMERLGLPAPTVGEDAAYPLAQTSCPALNASPAALDQPGVEARLLAPGALRTEAWALFLGLAREWAPDAAWPVDSLEVRDAAGSPVGGAAVTLGAALVVETDALGRARFARTESGPIEAEVNDPRATARVILLESQRGAVLTGGRGR